MFSAPGTYPACGMFVPTHFIAMFVCFLLVIIGVVLSRKLTKEQMNKITKIVAIVITVLEVVKIFYNIYYEGFKYPNNFIPLHYCSLFIYSLWFAGYGKGIIKNVGESFLSGGCIIAGGFFLILPSTSLQLYPIFHFQCIYSLLFHSLMLYFGLMYFIKGYFKLSVKNYVYYVIFCSIACILAFTIIYIFKTNLMFIDNPWGFPIELLHTIRDKSLIAYALIIYIAYSVLVYLPTMGVRKLIFMKEGKN